MLVKQLDGVYSKVATDGTEFVQNSDLGLFVYPPILLGPDEESEQWAAAIAAREQLTYSVAGKQRFGDKQLQVTLPPGHFEGRSIELVAFSSAVGLCAAGVIGQLLFYFFAQAGFGWIHSAG